MIPTLGIQRQVGLCEFKVRLLGIHHKPEGCIVSVSKINYIKYKYQDSKCHFLSTLRSSKVVGRQPSVQEHGNFWTSKIP